MDRDIKVQLWLMMGICILCAAITISLGIQRDTDRISVANELYALQQDISVIRSDVTEIKEKVKPESTYKRTIDWILGKDE